MADSQVKTANICNITSSTLLKPNAGGSGTYIADNSISVHMTNQHRASGIYISSLPEQSVIGDKYTISFVPVCATNNAMLVVLYGATTQISFTSGNRYTLTITATAADNTVAFYGGDTVEKTVIIKDIQIEKGENATPYHPYSATGWQHSLRKLTTATDTFTTLPVDIYADGNNATVGLKGNTVQNGTPTPSNPVDVNGVGVRTAQLLDFNTWANNVYVVRGTKVVSGNSITIASTAATCFTGWNTTEYPATARIPVTEGETIHLTWDTDADDSSAVWIFPNASATGEVHTAASNKSLDYTVPSGVDYITFRLDVATANKTITYSNIMFSSGSTAKPYEPYGYKIPISSANTTTPVYLGEVETTRKIKKLVLTGDEDSWHISGNFFYNDNINPDYLRTSYRTVYCTHYQGINNVTAGSQVGDGKCAFYSSVGVQRLYIKDSNYSTVASFTTYLQQQYAAGTPVTVWYVLATETTGVVNEPLRKIGDYADTVSGITIPTITGKGTFDVLTTLKPSEVSLAYTGWHDASVKEKSRNLYNINAKDVNNGYVNSAQLNQDGTTEPWTPCEVTEYIELVPNVSYRLSKIGSYNSLAYCIYDDDKQYITGEQYSGQPVKTINMPPNGKYVRFSHYKTITETMLNEGSTALPYEPYWK